jgi:hypothetical protein
MCQFSSIKAISVAIIKKEGKFVISKSNICKYSLKLILYLHAVSLLLNLKTTQRGRSVLFSHEQKLLFEGRKKGFA